MHHFHSNFQQLNHFKDGRSLDCFTPRPIYCPFKQQICEQASNILHHINCAELFAENSAMARLRDILRGWGPADPWNIHKWEPSPVLCFVFCFPLTQNKERPIYWSTSHSVWEIIKAQKLFLSFSYKFTCDYLFRSYRKPPTAELLADLDATRHGHNFSRPKTAASQLSSRQLLVPQPFIYRYHLLLWMMRNSVG